MDTDPNSEVSALLDALDNAPAEETTVEDSEVESQEESQASSAEHQDETTTDENSEGESLIVEFDGKQWELPAGTPPEVAEGVKKVADELKADYTRKQQTRAEDERRVKAQAQQLQEAQQMAQATFGKRIELGEIAQQIKALDAIDFEQLSNSDPVRAMQVQMRYTQLQTALNKGQSELQQMAQAEGQRIAAEKQRLKQELIEAAPTLIPGYNAKINQELMDTIVECGFTPEEAGDILDPRLLKLINMARMGRQVQKATPKTLQKVAQAPKVIKAVASQPKPQNQAAADRLKKTGRPQELINFL